MTEAKRSGDGPHVPFCEEKQRLVGGFLAANHVLMDLQNQQTQAVIDGDPEFSRYDDLIHMAREKKRPGKICTHRTRR
jgi:hypothetical protein